MVRAVVTIDLQELAYPLIGLRSNVRISFDRQLQRSKGKHNALLSHVLHRSPCPSDKGAWARRFMTSVCKDEKTFQKYGPRPSHARTSIYATYCRRNMLDYNKKFFSDFELRKDGITFVAGWKTGAWAMIVSRMRKKCQKCRE